MSNIIVRAVLETRLKDWAAAQSPPILIAYEGTRFAKPEDGSPYLECFLIPNTPINHAVDGTKKTLYGLFQVNVWTQGGTGSGAANLIAEGIVGLFPLIPKFSAVSVEQTPSPSQRRPDPSGWDITPVLIKYRYEGSV